jgi:6-phosphogluconate dehydrogenase
MPSLLGTTVTTNYLRNPGTSSQFGTRDLVFIKVAVTGGSNDMRYQDGATSGLSYNLSNSLFQKAVNVLQGFGEVYFVGAPGAGGFVAAIASDTRNGADSGNTQASTYGLLEAAINAALNASASTTVSELSVGAASIA